MDPVAQIVVTAIVILFASVIQRITGMGFALAATPALVLLYGVEEGVKASVGAGLVLSVLMVSTLLKNIDWRTTGWLVLGGAVAAPFAAWIAISTPTVWLTLLVGVLALLSLLGGAWRFVQRALIGVRGATAAGAASGLMHVLSGLSGPPLAMYALQNQWDQRRFVASIQVVFISLHLLTLGFRGMPEMPWSELGILSLGVAAGLLMGSFVGRYVSAQWARRGMLGVAWAGTLTVLMRGIIGLWA